VQREQKFSLKVTSGRITEEKSYATNAFEWKNLFIYFCRPFRTSIHLLLVLNKIVK
jgi:hypothetical protein